MDIDETVLPDEAPADYVLRLAAAKARPAGRGWPPKGLPARPLLAADTTVTVDGEILASRPTPLRRAPCCNACPAAATRCSPPWRCARARADSALSVSRVELLP